MNGFRLEFFTEQNRRHGHQALWEWVLDIARTRGIRGATVFTGAAGFGHSRRLHSARFFELADQPVVITMAVTAGEAEQLIDFLNQQQVHLFYVKSPAEFGETGTGGNQEPPAGPNPLI